MGKYLGLPETFGRGKRDVFTGMVDKIRQRAQSWPTRFLSGAGKHVMLQSVLTSLPTYSMSSFKIPISLCKRIQSILTRFWWDSAPEKRKIAWVAWSTMAQPKHLGGLGFKNIEDYNDSLLAKLGWRILNNPISLLALVLKGKYFSDCTFIESKDKTGSSHGWTSIQAGKSVLEKGLGFLVGNGENIRVWSDKWPSPLCPITPIGPPTYENQNLMVADLLDPQTNEWDLHKLQLHLPHYEEIIRLIIPSVQKPNDKQVWLPDPSGVYTSKSGYKKLFEEKVLDHPDPLDWMQLIWKLHVSPKLQHFLWRALKNALPVGAQLAIRGIQAELNCKRCGELESISHLFLSCPFAVEFWKKVPIQASRLGETELENLRDWLTAFVKSPSLPPVGLVSSPLILWLLWNLWTARNKLVFEGKIYHEEDIISKSIAEAKAWEEANVKRAKHQKKRTPVSKNPLNTPSCWCDGAWQESTKAGGMGWIIKNTKGEVIC